MNFYKHHLGDYAQATGHLTFVEDAAYCRLIRKYYADEKPIPADIKAAQRLVGARSRDEKDAVQSVLEEFFTLQDDGWHNKRCDEELEKANAQAETNRRIAEDREAKRRARIENEQSTNRATDRSTIGQPSQTPDTRHQTPEKTIVVSPPAPPQGTRLDKDWRLPDDWQAWCREHRPDLDPQSVAEQFRDFWIAKPGKDGRKADWMATWRNWCRSQKPGVGRRTEDDRRELFRGAI